MALTQQHRLDDAGRPAGGEAHGTGIAIHWQDGPLGAPGSPERKEPNGAFVEQVIEAALGRLEFYQRGPFKCEENATAVRHLQLALAALHARTARRTAAGTEGTHQAN